MPIFNWFESSRPTKSLHKFFANLHMHVGVLQFRMKCKMCQDQAFLKDKTGKVIT